MSIIDAKLKLSDAQAVTVTADTTNTLDFGGTRDLSNNYHGAGYVNVKCLVDVAGTSLTFQLKDSADNSTFATVGDVLTLTGMDKGQTFSLKMPKTKRYVKGAFTATAITAGTFDVFVGQPEA